MRRAILSLFVFVVVSPPCAAAAPVFPGKDWERKEPADVGIDAVKIKAFAAALGGRGCVVRQGYLVYSWGDIDKPADVASAAKPVYAHFLWKAMDAEKIASLDERVSKYEPGLDELNRALDTKDRLITWKHLVTQTSCYGVREAPGSAFDYNDYQMALFWDLLFIKVYGAAPKTVDAKVLRPGLAEPLGFHDKATLLAFGPNDRAGRLAISPRDFARFGLLYLRGGAWHSKQLLPPESVRTAVGSPLAATLARTKGQKAEMLSDQRTIGGGSNQSDHFGQYSYLWWGNINKDAKPFWPDLPWGAYAALGHGGKRGLLVVPSLDLLVSWNDAAIDGRAKQNDVLKLAVRSVVETSQR